MDRKSAGTSDRIFTAELYSRSNVKEVAAPGGSQRVTIEGTIGKLQHARFVENAVLELTGSGGILRVDLSREDLVKNTRKVGASS